MDVLTLKDKLSNDSEKITYILEEAGFENIHPSSSNQLRFNYEDGDSNSVINIETLSVSCFSRNIKGDIFTLIQHKKNIDFYKSFQWICKKLGYNSTYKEKSVHLPFNGVWKKFSKVEEDSTYEVLDENILSQYKIQGNLRFLRDGIDLQTQEKFGCFYDIESNRLGICWHDVYNRPVGIMGRYNSEDYEKDKVAKWFPIIPFSKSPHLFGLNVNRDKIIEKDVIFIGESEKFVLQLASMGLNIGVALGGNALSKQRVNLIHGLRVKNIYLMLDEGLEESHSRELAEQLKCETRFYTNNVYYVYDKDNKYLKKGSKDAPTDLDYEDFKKLMKECSILV